MHGVEIDSMMNKEKITTDYHGTTQKLYLSSCNSVEIRGEKFLLLPFSFFRQFLRFLFGGVFNLQLVLTHA